MSAATDLLKKPMTSRRKAAAPADELPVRIGGMEYARTTITPTRLLGFDQALIWVCVALLAWGL